MPELPIVEILPSLVEALHRSTAAVLVAPPGAGKTTRVPLALLEAGLAGSGQIVLLQPRRLATRAVARMMADLLGEPLGRTVGYRVRFEGKSSAATRILVVTEGILTRRLLADPVLEGVGCVILDEFHERSLHADLALAFLRELAEVREDLKLVVMSATLEADPVARYLGGCPQLSCAARQHPLRIEHLAPEGSLLARGRRGHSAELAAAVRRALQALLGRDDDGGDLLVFLPGAPEIQRVLQHLQEHPLPGQPELVPLYGALGATEQDRALRPGQSGRRVVLATNIAETSLTVPGVTAVVDAGLVKQPRLDPATGLDRLELVRISRSSADQRAGRAGRLGPGRALRLWSGADHAGLVQADLPEIQRVDLAPALLAVLTFRPGDPRDFPFFEPPAATPLEGALSLLRMLGAVDPRAFTLTPLGRRLAQLPVHPRLGAILLEAEAAGLAADGALLAALLAERDLLPRDTELPTRASDLVHRLELLRELEAAGFAARAARRLGVDLGAAHQVRRAREQLLGLVAQRAPTPAAVPSLGRLVLAGYPDRVCRRRGPRSPEAVMVGGRGVRLAPSSGVREAELFLALAAEAGPRGERAQSLVRVASAVTEEDLAAQFPELLQGEELTTLDGERVKAVRQLRFADLVLREEEIPAKGPAAAQVLAAAAAERFDQLFRPDRAARQLLGRLQLARAHLGHEAWPDASPDGLRALLPELCVDRRTLEEIRRIDWAAELLRRLTGKQRQILQRELPERVPVPSGREIAVDYTEGAPVLAVKLQEMFGQADTPTVLSGRLPLRLHLLAPNGRPVQVTQDLRSFWDGAYKEVRKDLRGRYPKHPWPEDPWSAPPTARVKRRR